MRIETFSILAGSEACNARCPFCVSKMTPPLGVDLKAPPVNWRNFDKACKLAKQSGVTTVMFTGKGEPTLFPEQIDIYLEVLKLYDFPLIEIQTNGILLHNNPQKYDSCLGHWFDSGMTTIAISIVHHDPEKNRQVYLPYKDKYIDLPDLIAKLHSIGFSVRLTCVGIKGFIDNSVGLWQMINFAKENNVEQLTFTPVNKPTETINNPEVWSWTKENHISPEGLRDIIEMMKYEGHKLMTLSHGATVYDIEGQNFCLNHCLTVQPENNKLRNLIFFPDGHLRYYWQYPGAIIL